MAKGSGYSDLVQARRETATQLLAVAGVLERLQTGAMPGQVGTLRDSTAGESLNVLRQMLRLLALIQSAQSAARATGQGAGLVSDLVGLRGGGSSGGFLGGLLGMVSKGLGIASLATSIVGLFRGSPKPEASPTPFTAPGSLALEVANTDNILRGFPRFDFNAGGERRVIDETPAAAVAGVPGMPSDAATTGQPLQVTVNVNAMDSRSFRDHAPELAEAVRDAMLHLHPINQVVRDWA